MTNQNENTQLAEVVVQENEKYQIIQLENGEFKKQMKYEKYYTHLPETQEEQIELYNVFNSSDNEDLVTPFSNLVGTEIGIDQFYLNPYESFDEKTGINTPGVTTTIKDGENFYTTSSKSVYHSLRNMCEAFGYPNTPNYKKLYVFVTGTKRQNGVQIDIKLSRIGE